jgi:hypothetical protein
LLKNLNEILGGVGASSKSCIQKRWLSNTHWPIQVSFVIFKLMPFRFTAIDAGETYLILAVISGDWMQDTASCFGYPSPSDSSRAALRAGSGPLATASWRQPARLSWYQRLPPTRPPSPPQAPYSRWATNLPPIEGSQCGWDRPGFGGDAVSQKLRCKNHYIVVLVFKRNGSQNGHYFGSISFSLTTTI